MTIFKTSKIYAFLALFFLILPEILLLSGCFATKFNATKPTPIISYRKSPIETLTLSPDGRFLMAGQKIETEHNHSGIIPLLQLLDLESPDAKMTMEAGATPNVTGVFAENGQMVLAPHQNGLTRLRLKDGFVDKILIADRVKLISPNGNYIATVSQEKKWKILSSQTQNIIVQLPDNVEQVIAFSPTENIIAVIVKQDDSAKMDKTEIAFWTFEEGKAEIGSTFAIDLFISGIGVFSPDGRWFAAAKNRDTLGIWDVQTGRLRNTADQIDGDIQALAFSPDGNRLGIGTYGKNGKVFLWNLLTGDVSKFVKNHQAPGVTAICFTKNGDSLYTGDSNGNVILWNSNPSNGQKKIL